jgi:hypothetical protein
MLGLVDNEVQRDRKETVTEENHAGLGKQTLGGADALSGTACRNVFDAPAVTRSRTGHHTTRRNGVITQYRTTHRTDKIR